MVISDTTITTRNDSIINIYRTVFIMALLTIGSIMFNQDANKLVLEPLETISE